MNKNPSIVYIEDNKFNIKLIQNVGEKLGLNIKAFENPKEGLEFCKNNEVDLLLVDYMMPELNGIDLVSALKQEKPDIPVIMVTALDDLKLRKKATLSGIDEFLPKPVNINEFKDIVFKLLAADKKKDDGEIIKEIINAEDDLILILENGKISHVNRSFLIFFEYANESSANFDFLKKFVVEEKYAWGHNIDEFIQSILKKTQLVKVQKDNEDYFFKVKITIYKQKRKTIIIFKDVTEKVKLEENNKKLEKEILSLQRQLMEIKEAGFFEKIKILFFGD